ncbi:MAG: LysR family transcriptional regulator [Alphaproteobacteria bacterium]|nr:LysR family transcriptional regulator [Alphaproteobacteria bacterium]
MLQVKLNQLRIFLAVYESLSTAKAAELVHRTQPSVSAAISSLERTLNLKLFERNSRGMEPTPAAAALAQRAASAHAQLHAAEAHFVDLGHKPPGLWERATDLQLRGLSALVHHGSFLLAARALRCSEPSMHRAVSALSQLIRCPLWKRAGRGIDPTREALILAEGIGRCESEVRLGLEAAQEINGIVRGQLLIGALPTARPGWLPGAITSTLKRHPSSRVSVMDGPYEEQLVALRHGRIDMIIGALRASSTTRDLEQVPIFEDTLSIAVRASHALAPRSKRGNRPLASARLTSLSWLLPPVGTPPRQCFDDYLQARGLPPAQCVVECNSLVTIWSLLMATDCAAVIPTSQTRSELIRGCLSVLGKPIDGSRHPVGLAVRRGFTPTRLQSVFIDNLKSASAALVSG